MTTVLTIASLGGADMRRWVLTQFPPLPTPLIRETRETFGMTEKQLGTLIADLQAKGILG